MNIRRLLPIILLIASTTALIWWHFAKLLRCPSCYLFVDGGDGLKNYFTAIYYVLYDRLGWWFAGMNYPYGEHVVYTDNQPIWSVLIKMVGYIIPMEDHVPGAMNMLMVFSLLIAVVCVYFLLRRMGVSRWFAAVSALPVVFLSPQIARFNGHYSLAYVYYLPLFLCLFVWWTKSPLSVWRISLLTLWTVWMGFTHLYFLFIALVFIVAYTVLLWIMGRFHLQKQMFSALGVVVASGVLVYGPVKLTDPVKDRPREVYGLYVYTTGPEGTFLPWYEPIGTFWKEELAIKRPDFEGHNYVGATGTLLFLFILYGLILLVLRRWRSRVHTISWTATPAKLLCAALLVWFLATGWFYSLGGSLLLEVAPVLGQFRSLGRLGWIFYYMFGCYVAYFMYREWQRSQAGWRKWVLTVLCALGMTLWYAEAWVHFKGQTEGIYRLNQTFRGERPFAHLLEESRYKADHFQAILQFPMVFIGEKYTVTRGLWPLHRSMQCAYETGLPIVDSNMSRTSVRQALSHLQLLSRSSIRKVRLDTMDERPLLLLVREENIIEAERQITKAATLIGHVGEITVYSLMPDNIRHATPEPPPAEILSYLSFDELVSKHAYRGSGALRISAKDQVLISYTHRSTRETLYLSYWVRVAYDEPGFPPVRRQSMRHDGSLLSEDVLSMFNHYPVDTKGDWVGVVWAFDSGDEGTVHMFTALNKGGLFDECRIVRLREADSE